MSTPKPRIRPKAEGCRPQREPPLHDMPLYPEFDLPPRPEHDPGMERRASGRVVYFEDDCLR